MTNEELAAQAKAGDKDALAQLWEQNRGLLAKLFGELAHKAGARMAATGVTWEDVTILLSCGRARCAAVRAGTGRAVLIISALSCQGGFFRPGRLAH